MTRRGAAWLLAVPLMAAGTEAAHWLAYRLAYPSPYVRAQVLASTGHGYLRDAPDAAALAGALVLAALLARVFARPDSSPATPGLMPLLAVPPLAFALQECIEEAASGHSPLLAAYAPTFLPGLLLTLPCALAVALLARLLLGGADRLAAVWRGAVPRRTARAAAPAAPARGLLAPPRLLLAGGLGERGPPRAARRA